MATPTSVSFEPEGTSGEAPFDFTVAVDAVDLEGSLPEFTISWGDGNESTVTNAGESATHTYLSAGQYTVSATVAAGSDVVDVDDDIVVTVASPVIYPALTDPGGVCVPWVAVTELCNSGDDTFNTELAQSAVDVATRWLNDATGQRWSGPCTSMIRPLMDSDPLCTPRKYSRQPIDLTLHVSTPVLSVVELRVDGVAIDTSWVMLSDGKLSATRGYGDDPSPLIPWPTQDSTRPDGAVDTWDLTVIHGAGPPEPLRRAAVILAEEVMKQACGDESCGLPSNATSVSRDGVTIQLMVPTGGKTGIPQIDAQIDMYGPNGYGARPRRMLDPAANHDARVVRY